MRISELVSRADVPLATVKFYIREGMLPPGRVTSARRADYDESHLQRLRLIRSLTVVAGLPLNRAKRILEIIDHPEGSLYHMLGQAIEALAGSAASDAATPGEGEAASPRARAALTDLGPAYARSEDRMAAFAQLDAALAAAEESGVTIDRAQLRLYGEHMAAIARAEVDALPRENPRASIQYAVLGTALGEPVLAALRRLAHQNLAAGLEDSTR